MHIETAIIVLMVFIILAIAIYYMTKKETFSSQGGALIQLMAKDPQDSYLITGSRPYYPYFPYYYPYHLYPYPYLYY